MPWKIMKLDKNVEQIQMESWIIVKHLEESMVRHVHINATQMAIVC